MEDTPENKNVPNTYQMQVEGEVIEGRILDNNEKGYTVKMTKPFDGLMCFIPIAQAAGAHDQFGEKVKAALFLLNKKAKYYVEHQEEIERKYDDFLWKLNKKNIEKNKIHLVDELHDKKLELKKQYKGKSIDEKAYQQSLREARKEMYASFKRIAEVEDKIEKQLFQGVLSLDDVQKFRRYFLKH